MLVSTTPDCSGFSKVENHSLWYVRWFDAPESIYHTSFCLEVFTTIELALCFIAKARSVLAHLEPSAYCDLPQY